MGIRFGILFAALSLASLSVAAICGNGDGRSASSGAAGRNGGSEWIDAFPGSTFSGRFDYTGGEEGFSGDGSLRLYKKGADRIRVDFRFTIDSGGLLGGDASGTFAETAMTIIQTPGVNVLCMEEPGFFGIFGLNKPHTCLNSDDVGDDNGFSSDDLLHQIAGSDGDKEYTEATIAGRDARCYKSNGTKTLDGFDDMTPDDASSPTPSPTPTGPGEVCFSREGWLLRITGTEATEGAQQVSDAQELTGDVDDGAFDLPYPIFEPPSIEVRNDSDVDIFVELHSDDATAFGGVQSNDIDAHSSKTIHGGLDGTPARVEFGTYTSPQWALVCGWDEAKAHEPLVIGDDTSNCAGATRRPGWDPNTPRYSDDSDYGTPVPDVTIIAINGTPVRDGPRR